MDAIRFEIKPLEQCQLFLLVIIYSTTPFTQNLIVSGPSKWQRSPIEEFNHGVDTISVVFIS